MDEMISMKHVCKSFGSLQVLKDISQTVERGEILAVIGPSGSGKSTLVRCINGLERIDAGEVLIEGNPVLNPQSMAAKVGMVFQNFNLFPHYTVLDNIVRPCRIVKKMPLREAEVLAMSVLETVHLSDKAGEYPSRLSGGQKQRVAIARALSMKPEIMLFDEPTSSLDPELAYEVFDTLKSITRKDMTIILVTHQLNMVRDFASRVLFLEHGSIAFDGTPGQLLQTEDGRIIQFMEKIFF